MMIHTVSAPAPAWNAEASALGGGHVRGMTGLDVLQLEGEASAKL